jgi:1,4-dihydroxy-2-naphthoate octaprenyltransferase
MATRPPTLPAAVAPVLVGAAVAIAEDSFAWGPALAAMFGALCLQVGANFANDVFDFHRGADTADRLGPPRATQMGLLSSREVLTGMWLVFGLAMLAGIYLVAVAGWPVVVMGLASILAAIIYTGGPWPIGYHALGDLFTFVFFGLVAVAGTAFVQSEELTRLAVLAALPMGCTVTAILVVNNLRDLDTDRGAGKHTLAVYLGDRATRWWYTTLVIGAYLLAGVVAVTRGSPAPAVVVFSLPLAVPLLRTLLGGLRGPGLNAILRATARFHLAFGVLLALGIAFS